MVTRYTDIAGMSAPMKFGYLFSILNQEVATKYFKIVGVTSGGGWTPQAAQDLGGINTGVQTFFDVKDVMQRTMPASPVTDDVIIQVQRYDDAGYITLEETADSLVQHKFIDSDSMTLLDLDNFDDGTVQGWVLTQQSAGYVIFGVDSTYFISPNHSIRMRGRNFGGTSWRDRWGMVSKSFDVPSAGEAYFIVNVMVRKDGSPTHFSFRISNNGAIAAELNPTDHNMIFDKWLRLVIPLVPGTTNTVDLYHRANVTDTNIAYIYFDDIKVVYS